MAAHGLRMAWNISSFRGMVHSLLLFFSNKWGFTVLNYLFAIFLLANTIISSLLAPVTRLRLQACSIHSSVPSSQLLDKFQLQRENNSPVAQSDVIKPNEDDVITPNGGGKSAC